MLRLGYIGGNMTEGKGLKQVKAERAAKKKKARRRKRTIFLLVELIVFVVLVGVGYVMTKYGKIQLNMFDDKDIQFNQGVVQTGYTTIALFGGDSREGQLEAGTHADTMILASIDNTTKEIKLISVYRDLITSQDEEMRKANSAYFLGGPKAAINMLNRNFDLNIEDYVTVDFKAMADAVDLLGGIELDVSQEEAEEINRHIVGSGQAVGKPAKLMEAGLQTLDGVQALTYARIRKNVGGDYARTGRQREVIQKLAEKAKQTDLLTLNKIIDKVFPQISTSFSLKELLALGKDVLRYQIGETSGYAFEYTDGVVEGLGSVVIPLGHVENVQELHEFLYPKSTYSPSDTVKEIAQKIEELTGYTRDDYKSKETTTDTE